MGRFHSSLSKGTVLKSAFSGLVSILHRQKRSTMSMPSTSCRFMLATSVRRLARVLLFPDDKNDTYSVAQLSLSFSSPY